MSHHAYAPINSQHVFVKSNCPRLQNNNRNQTFTYGLINSQVNEIYVLKCVP